jgi:hypothetical protein
MSWQLALMLLGLAFVALAVLCCFVEHESKRGLPPPDQRTLRSPDWRRYELHTPRKYIP